MVRCWSAYDKIILSWKLYKSEHQRLFKTWLQYRKTLCLFTHFKSVQENDLKVCVTRVKETTWGTLLFCFVLEFHWRKFHHFQCLQISASKLVSVFILNLWLPVTSAAVILRYSATVITQQSLVAAALTCWALIEVTASLFVAVQLAAFAFCTYTWNASRRVHRALQNFSF